MKTETGLILTLSCQSRWLILWKDTGNRKQNEDEEVDEIDDVDQGGFIDGDDGCLIS